MEPREVIEQAIVAAAFQGHQEADSIAAQILDTDIQSTDLRAVWRVLKAFTEAGTEFDPVMVLDELSRRCWLTQSIGLQLLIDLQKSRWEAAHIDHYCEILRRYVASDSVRLIGEQLAGEPQIDQEIIDQYITKLDEVKRGRRDEIQSASDAVEGMIVRRASPLTVHATGIRSLDERIRGGLRDGQIMVVGGRPGAGKSVLLMQIAANMAERGEGALVVTLEMLKEEIAERLSKTRATGEISELPMWFIDSTSDLGAIQSLIRVACRRHRIGVVVVDYLQLCEVSAGKNENRERQIATISRRLKRLAMDLQVPIIVGSQLNRESTKRGKPTLADLRESGAIEQDADIVVLLSKSEDSPDSVVDIAKQRGGGTGEITMRLIGAEFRFEEEAKEFYQGKLID